MTTDDLLALSDARGYIEVPAELSGLEAASVLLPSGNCAWTVDRRGLTAEEYNWRLAHELGHCEEGAFYTRYSPPAARYRAEGLAERWSYRKMIPTSALLSAFSDGCTEAWEIAERLNVPPQMVIKAVEYYRAAFSARFNS